jgi:CRP-like cAMP-binding protein
MTTQGAVWYLKRSGLFEHLTPTQADRLERNALARSFERGNVIYAPEDSGESVFLVTHGRIKIKDITPDGKESIIAFIDEGELFGELALVDDEPRREYAEAACDARVLLFQRVDLKWLMQQRPDFALSVTKLVGLRRRRIENRLRNILFLPSAERLMRLLAELAQSHGERHERQCMITLPLSHQDFAGLIGVTRETVTGILGKLRADGLIQIRRRRVVIVDMDRLHAMCSAAMPVTPRSPAVRGRM